MPLSNFLKYTKGGLKAIAMIARNPKNLYYITHQESVFQRNVARLFPAYQNGLPQINLTDLSNPVDETIKPYSMLGGTSEPIDIALLRVLAKKFEGCKYFEIGTWRGESIVNLLDVTSTRLTMNLPVVEDSPHKESHQFYMDDSQNIEKIEANSLEYDFSQLPKMDLIFIDGDHHQETVASDTSNVFKHLTHDKSMIVWHDYTSHFSNISWEVLLGILNGCPKQHHDRLYHVRNTNCAVYLPAGPPASTNYDAWVPQDNFEIHIKSYT